MPGWEQYAALLDSIHQEWNQAERDLKQAEQVCSKVIFPAIKELRYAGRRLADALHLVSSGGDPRKVEELLIDARFDCHRARHDAIDAATAKIAIDIEVITDKLGHDIILKAYPDFAVLSGELYRVRDAIVNSRENRHDRDAIYQVIEDVDFPELCKKYFTLRSSEHVMVKLARRARWARLRNSVLGYGGLLLTIVIATLAWLFPRAPH